MDQYTHLIEALHSFPSKKWINSYFDVQKKLFETLEIENDNPCLALTLTKQNTMPVNLGQRYVLQPYSDGSIGCIVPIHFEELVINAESVFEFTQNKIADAKFIVFPFNEGNPFPQIAWDRCIECCDIILKHIKKSGFRKHHVQLL